MKSIKVLLLLILVVSTIFAQDGSIIPGQKSAIAALATQNGFTQLSLDNYLQLNYSSNLQNLSKENAVLVIQAFQSNDKPSPSLMMTSNPVQTMVQQPKPMAEKTQAAPITASILETGMAKRFYG